MTKKLEDYELMPESEVSDKNKNIYEKWRNKWRKANEELFENDPTTAETQLEDYITYKVKILKQMIEKNMMNMKRKVN